MLWSIRYRLFCGLLRLLVRCGLDELDLENAVLRHQLKILRRRRGRRLLFTTADRAFLTAVARFLSRDRWSSFLVGPDTMARWHRDLLKRRLGSRPPGRPPLDPSIKHLILRLGRENPRWGYLRIRGELLKLGIDVSATTIATVLREGGLGPAPRRIGPTWTQFLRLQAYAVLLPEPRSDPGEDLRDLVAGPQRYMPVPVSDDPVDDDHHESINEAPLGPQGNPIAVLGAPPPSSVTSVPADSGTRARDGPRMAA